MAEYTKHDWAGAWVNSLFRKECAGLASDYILAAVAATRYYYPDVPNLGMITFINPRHVKPIMRRGVPVWGYSYLKAGFQAVGTTRGGLLAFQLLPAAMPAPLPAARTQMEFAL